MKFFCYYSNTGELLYMINPAQITFVDVKYRALRMSDGFHFDMDADCFAAFTAHAVKEGVL